MANIQLTNASSEDTLYIEVDKGDRFNRYAKWVLDPSEVKSVDEAEVDITTDFALQTALSSGKMTITESDLEDLSYTDKKNFIGAGIGVIFKNAGVTITANRIVALDTTNNTIKYVTTQGDLPFGVSRASGTTGESIRVMTSGTPTLLLREDVEEDDYLVSDTTGGAVISTTVGDYAIGQASADGTGDTEQDITIAIAAIE